MSPLRKKAVTRKSELRLQKIYLETLWQGHTLSSDMFFETPSAGAPPFCLTSSSTSLQDAPHLSASRHLPRYRGSLPRFNGGIHLHQPGKGQDQNKKAYFSPFQSFYIQGKGENRKNKTKNPARKAKTLCPRGENPYRYSLQRCRARIIRTMPGIQPENPAVIYGKVCGFLKSILNYLFIAFSTATATATVAPTMGLLPIPMRPIISTCAGTDEDPANCASECILPIVSVMP